MEFDFSLDFGDLGNVVSDDLADSLENLVDSLEEYRDTENPILGNIFLGFTDDDLTKDPEKRTYAKEQIEKYKRVMITY